MSPSRVAARECGLSSASYDRTALLWTSTWRTTMRPVVSSRAPARVCSTPSMATPSRADANPNPRATMRVITSSNSPSRLASNHVPPSHHYTPHHSMRTTADAHLHSLVTRCHCVWRALERATHLHAASIRSPTHVGFRTPNPILRQV